jgi:hypothetical protein
MSDDLIGYNEMVDNAMLNVVRQAVDFAVENGLPGKHHFYITFKTEYPGVDIPDHLHQRYPDEMTIVLQHQFWNLSTAGNAISVDLSFNQKLEHLHIPLAAIVTFADPSVNFGLQFHNAGEAEIVSPTAAPKQAAESKKPDPEKETKAQKKTKSKTSQDDDAASGNVVTLDAFRKK